MRRIAFTLFTISLALPALTALPSCAAGQTSVTTGVVKQQMDDGSVQYIFTARASLNARQKDSTVMMQATSRDAARLLFKNEFRQNDLDESKFKITGWEFVRRGEFCRLRGVYYPGGIP